MTCRRDAGLTRRRRHVHEVSTRSGAPLFQPPRNDPTLVPATYSVGVAFSAAWTVGRTGQPPAHPVDHDGFAWVWRDRSPVVQAVEFTTDREREDVDAIQLEDDGWVVALTGGGHRRPPDARYRTDQFDRERSRPLAPDRGGVRRSSGGTTRRRSPSARKSVGSSRATDRVIGATGRTVYPCGRLLSGGKSPHATRSRSTTASGESAGSAHLVRDDPHRLAARFVRRAGEVVTPGVSQHQSHACRPADGRGRRRGPAGSDRAPGGRPSPCGRRSRASARAFRHGRRVRVASDRPRSIGCGRATRIVRSVTPRANRAETDRP